MAPFSIHSRRLASMTFVLVLSAATAQSQTHRESLEAFVERENAEYHTRHEDAVARATELQLPLRRVLPDGTVFALQYFEDGRPVYFITTNAVAAATVSTDQVWVGGALGFDLDGSGQTLGIWDGGDILDVHQEFGGRVTSLDAAPVSNHATRVAGTLIASGVNAAARGMSGAAALRGHDFNNDEAEMAAEQLLADPIRVSNHSYGFLSGWRNNFFGDGLWAWFGDVTVSLTEDPVFGLYDESCADWDQIAFDAPDYMPVKASGNDRNDSGPAPGTLHWHFDGTLDDFVQDTDTHPADGGVLGYDTIIGGSSSAKNVLTIGAVHDIPGGWTDPSDVVQSAFSGWGPTDDGRVKPDLVANGVSLFTTNGSSPTAYTTFGGTSASTPNAAGSLGLLNQQAEDLLEAGLRASTIKALVVNTANEAGPAPGPDYMNGWGLLDTAGAAAVIAEHARLMPFDFHLAEVTLTDEASLAVTSEGAGPLRVTIAWTDPPGTPPALAVDPPDPMLVNDVDLRLTGPTGTHLPWILDPADPAAPAITGDNFRDNVEQVYAKAPLAGTYTIEISHKGTLTGGQQIVSVCVTGNASPVFDDGFESGDTSAWSSVVGE